MAKKRAKKSSSTSTSAHARGRKKAPTTQASSFVAEEMDALHHGDSAVQSPKQAIAIGLSRARRTGVRLPAPKQGRTSAATRKKAEADVARGQGRNPPSPQRSRAAKKAARTRKARA